MKKFVLLFLMISIFVSNTVFSQNRNNAVLVLASQENFGLFIGEILKTEGFNLFETISPTDSKVNQKFLQQFDIVILAKSQTNDNLKNILSDYVSKGGNLIAFQPEKTMDELFGVRHENKIADDKYISIDKKNEICNGLTNKPLQLHVQADVCKSDAMSIAFFVDKNESNSEMPAIVFNYFGKGHAVAFLYNLPENIVYTRQGNPDFAGIEKDGINGLRAMDMFTDGWVDSENNTINQADEQMQLLTHIVEKMSSFNKPLPRFWYFPDSLKCVVTLTNDGENSSEADFIQQFQDVDSLGAKMSLYILDVDKVSKEWVKKWSAKGFEIAGHPDDTREAPNPQWENMNKALNLKKEQIAAKYGLPLNTNVNHWFVWCGNDNNGNKEFAAQAELEERSGIKLDINYAHYDMNSNQGHFLGTMGYNQGNFTGSGLVMKFATSKGKILNIYQHLNNVYDQLYMENDAQDAFFNCFKGLMDRSLHNEIYSFISVKAHNNEYFFSKKPLLQMITYANENGIPVWTAENLLNFIETRDNASFSDIKWEKDKLIFKIHSELKHPNNLTCMIPFRFEGKKIAAIQMHNKSQPFSVWKVKGTDYALFSVKPGSDYEIAITYSNNFSE